jgi:hypothetical protein
LLCETPYIRHAALRDAWTIATRGATIIDIRRVNRSAIEQTQHYLTDYLTKPPCISVLDDPTLLIEWIDGLTHRKVLLRFGRPILAQKPQPKPDAGDWCLIGSLIGLLTGAHRQNKRALYWLGRMSTSHVTESRDPDAGKDYSIDPSYHHALEQFF